MLSFLARMAGERQGARVAVGLAFALALGAVVGGANELFRVRPISKGWRAPYTMRAPCDIAWNQHETRAAEVRGFVPIYDQTPGVLEQRRRGILTEIGQLSAGFWHYPDADTEDAPDAGARAELEKTRV